MNVNTKIMKDYEKIRELNKSTQERIKNEIYLKIPRIKEIKDQLREAAFDMMSNVFKDIDSKASKKSFNYDEFVESRIQEIKNLLRLHGYEENVLELKYNCNLCKDTGSYQTKKCSCYEQKLIQIYYNQSNLSSKLEKENFENFDESIFSDKYIEEYGMSARENIVQISNDAKKFVELFNREATPNLILYGSNGLGKTFICSCIAKELIDNSYSVIYLTSTSLFNMIIQNKFSNYDADDEYRHEVYNSIYNSDLLILDDLGAEKKSEFTQSELFNIINERITNNKKMIISTNIMLNKIAQNYGERIASRIIGEFMPLHFFGDDLRLR